MKRRFWCTVAVGLLSVALLAIAGDITALRVNGSVSAGTTYRFTNNTPCKIDTVMVTLKAAGANTATIEVITQAGLATNEVGTGSGSALKTVSWEHDGRGMSSTTGDVIQVTLEAAADYYVTICRDGAQQR